MEQEQKETRVISFYNRKGGVGKTKLSTNFAAWCAFQGKKVLFIDLDDQCNGSCAIGGEREDYYHVGEGYVNILNLLGIPGEEGREEVPPLPIRTKGLISRAHYGVYYIKGSHSLSYLWQQYHSKDYLLLKKVLSDVRGVFDYVIIDLPPADGIVTMNGLIASDYVLCVAQCDRDSLKSVEYSFKNIFPVCREWSPDLRSAGLVINRYKRDQFSDFARSVVPTATRCSCHLYGVAISDSKGAFASANDSMIDRAVKSGYLDDDERDRTLMFFDTLIKKNYKTYYSDMDMFCREVVDTISHIETTGEVFF